MNFVYKLCGGEQAIIELPIKWELHSIYHLHRWFKRWIFEHRHRYKNRVNINKLLGRVLNSLDNSILVNSVSGGLKINAIPRKIQISLLVKKSIVNELEKMTFSNSCRSSIKSLKDDILAQLQVISEATDSSLNVEGIYPE